MKYCIIFLSILFFISTAKAEVYIEPYGNIGGSYSDSIPSPFINYGLGGRLGYSFLSVSTGVDVFWTNYGTGNGLNERSYYSSDRPVSKGFSQGINSVSLHSQIINPVFRPWAIGAFVALDLPIWFNGYGTAFYTFGSRSSVIHNGYGVKMGLSYLLVAYVQLSLEFQWAHYICPPSKQCSSDNFNIFSGALSLSVPLSFNVSNLIGKTDSEDGTDFSSSAETDADTSTDDDESNVF